MVQLGVESEDGWRPATLPANSTLLDWFTVPGANPIVSLQLMKGWPAKLLLALAADLNAFVEHMRDADSAGYTPTNIVKTSNHLNGTCFDFNWDTHKFHIWGTFNDAQMATLAEIFEFYTLDDGTCLITWGGKDWGGNPQDEMHFQMGYGTWNNPKVGDWIAKHIRADGFSTFRRGGQTGPVTPPMSNKERYVRATITTGQSLGISPRGIKIAISVQLVETNLVMYANENDAESLKYWHEAVGSDHLSSGLYQQQPPWGSIQCRMDPTCSTTLFFTADNGPGVRGLTKIRDANGNLYDYNDESRSPGFYAQKVQGSAFPDRYDKRFEEASRLYDQYVSTPTPSEEDFLMALSQEEQVEIRDKVRQLWGASFNPVSSKSRYGDPKDLWATKDFVRNDDGFLFDLITEHDASLGDAEALDRIQKAASKGDIVAQHFLDKLSNPAALQQVLSTSPDQIAVPAKNTIDNNITCWQCGKHYPDELPTCPFCGASQTAPEKPAATAIPAPVVESPGEPQPNIHVGQDVVDQLILLQKFKDELPQEVTNALEFLIPVLKGIVK